MSPHRVCVRNDFYKISLLLQFFYDSLSRLVAVHACVFAAIFIDRGVIVHDVDLRQVMALAYLEVIRVVSRCDLHRSGTELFVYIIIRNDRDFPAYKRQDYILPYNIFIALVIRMNGDRRISEHCLRTCGRNLEKTVCSHDRVFDMPEVSFLLLMLYLCIRQGSLTFRTPVDDP